MHIAGAHIDAFDFNKLLTLRKGKWRKNDRVDHAEDRRIRANSKRERQHDDRGESRLLREHTKCEANILPQAVHQVVAPRLRQVAVVSVKVSAGADDRRRSALNARAPIAATATYFSRMRSTLSHCDISERMTLSPTFKPDKISTVFTELRPSFTLTRSPSVSSGMTLKRLMVASVWPCTGRPR